MNGSLLLFILSSSILFTSCGLTTARPKEEMVISSAALQAAREAKAPTLSPTYYRKAETFFLKGKSSYKRKYFNKAKQYFDLSKKYSEKAEYMALRKATFKEGE